MGPDELVRLSLAASRYYRDGKSRVEIADELGISRFKVARMLEKAQEVGIVRIEIDTPTAVDLELSAGLRSKFGLNRAFAVATPSDSSEVVQDALGRVAADLLQEIVTSDDLLGLTAGRTLDAMTRHLTRLPYCDVVALGGVAGPVEEHGVEIIRRVGQVSGGRTYPIFAPLFVASADAARALRSDRGIADAYARFTRVTIGVVAVGSWNPPASQLFDAANEAGIAQALIAEGAVGEVGATLFDRHGRIISSIDDRSMAITAEQLRAIPEVIAVAGGEAKTDAVGAAIESGLVKSLVTDVHLARCLMERD
ncbi:MULTISPECIES: sugar-binding transcriptional regulator [unclassified Curtobacterium]|uniref:sugar-binding transcriptional regulator n=1 Tax=unclassified Curtobacterium TaxID=257496 RepID=UPI00226B123B|nr:MULTISPECIES: sugar-binding domain-containing protein [unclassified Curtobacterium]